MNNHSTKIEIGQIGNINDISGMLAIGGDVIAGNKTVIQNIIQQAIKKIISEPYKFLSSYEITDKDIFFGRDTLTEQLAGKVSRHRVLLINGASGSGKSSLINAGLIPRLAENGYTYLSFRDYHDPLRQLQDYLIETGLFPTAGLQVDLLTQMVRAFQQQQLPVVFIFDQFERFFVNVPSGARTQFIEMIKVCMESLQPNEMNVIFSMREEFFGQFQREFEKMIRAFLNDCERINIDPLSQEKAREAIIKPLTLIEAKIGYDEDFVDNVLLGGLEAETGEQKGINPPHLQIVCNQLYQSACQQLEHKNLVVIDNKLYEQLGGAQIILQTYLDDCVKTVAGHSLDHIKILRSLLKQMIETTTGTRKFVTTELLKEILPKNFPVVSPSDVEKFLQQLQDARIIEVRPQESTYSLSHEFMVKKVVEWFDEREMERRKAQETLEHGLAEWKDSGILLNDKQVDKIRNFLKDKQFNKLEQQLLLASEKFNRSQQRKNQLLRMSLVTFVLLAIGLGIVSYFKAVEAKQQARIALAGKLSTQAILASQVHGDFEQSLLLAVQAIHLLDDSNTQKNLHLVLQTTARVVRIFSKMYKGKEGIVVAFSPDDKYVISSNQDNTLILLDIVTGDPVGQPWRGHNGHISSAIFSSDGKYVASGSFDGTIILWETATGNPIGQPWRHEGRVRSVAFSPDDKYVASGTSKGVLLWEVATAKSIKELNLNITLTRRSRNLASGFSVWLNEVVTNLKELPPWQLERPKNVNCVAFSPNGKYIVGGTISALRLWEVATAKPVGEPWPVSKASNLPEIFNNIRVWYSLHHEYERPDLLEIVKSVSFSKDSKYVVSGGGITEPDFGIGLPHINYVNMILWDVETGKPIKMSTSRDSHESFVNSIAFDSEGKKIISGSSDRTLRLWKIGDEVLEIIGEPWKGHASPVKSVAFSHNGDYVISASHDSLILWKNTTEDNIKKDFKNFSSNLDYIRIACNKLTRNFTQEEWQHYLPDKPYQKTCPEYPSG